MTKGVLATRGRTGEVKIHTREWRQRHTGVTHRKVGSQREKVKVETKRREDKTIKIKQETDSHTLNGTRQKDGDSRHACTREKHLWHMLLYK